jgi:hypothetical protein
MEDEPTQTPPALAKLKATLDTKELRKAIKDARIEQPEEFRQQCLKFCEDLYDVVASSWTGEFNEENGWAPEFSSVSAVLKYYPELQSCWLSDIRSAIVNAAQSKGTSQSTRDFFYFMLGSLRQGWDGLVLKEYSRPRPE